MAHHLIRPQSYARSALSREEQLAAQLHALATRVQTPAVDIAPPAPDDYATPESWNALTASVAQTLGHLDARTSALRTRLNDADDRGQRLHERLTGTFRDLTDRLTDAFVVSPTHEYHLTDSFVSDRQVDPASTVRLDLDAQAVSLRTTGFSSILQTPSRPTHRMTVVFDDATDRHVLRGVGHRYGLVNDTADPEDRQTLNPDLANLTTDSPHQAVDLEQVGFMDDRQAVALRRARQHTGAHDVELRWPIGLLRLGHQPPLMMKLVLELDTPVMLNRLTLTQQPVTGSLASVYDVVVVTDAGARLVLLSGPVREIHVAATFSPLSVVRVEWGLLQTFYQPIPLSMSHTLTPGGLHLVAPV